MLTKPLGRIDVATAIDNNTIKVIAKEVSAKETFIRLFIPSSIPEVLTFSMGIKITLWLRVIFVGSGDRTRLSQVNLLRNALFNFGGILVRKGKSHTRRCMIPLCGSFHDRYGNR